MFRVPTDPIDPTFDSTFKVSFWGWLTSKAVDRKEWMRRRNEATWLAQRNQVERFEGWAARKEEVARQVRQDRDWRLAAEEDFPAPAMRDAAEGK